VSDTIQELLMQLHKRYAEGVSLPSPKETLDTDVTDLRNRLEADVRNHLRPLEMTLLKACFAAESKGLGAARSKHVQVAMACRYFGEARMACASSQLSEEGRMFARSSLAAAEAYLDYRCDDFDRAQERLCESLAADEILETTYGHSILHVHRLHIVNNLIRVEVQRGNVEGALDLAARLLCYMQGASDDGPTPGRWGKSYRDALPRETLSAMFVQVIGEIGQALVGKKPEAARSLFAIVEGQLPEPDFALWHPLASDWFKVKSAYVGGSMERYLRISSDYLGNGVGVAPALWRFVALDAVIAVDELPFPEAVELRREILRDALTWCGASARVRCLVTDLSVALEKESTKCA